MAADGTLHASDDRAGHGAATDVMLVRRVAAGSHDALASLYDRHVGVIYAAAVRTTNDRSIAAEVVQDTFLTLWDRAELFDPARGSLHAWLLTIARNRAVDHLRALRRHGPTSVFSAFDNEATDEPSVAEWLTAVGEPIAMGAPEPEPDEVVATKDVHGSIVDAVESLPPLERQVIMLAYAEGLSQSEIAAHLGWPLGTVKTRTRRALRQLRDRLESSQPGMWTRRAIQANTTATSAAADATVTPAVRARRAEASVRPASCCA